MRGSLFHPRSFLLFCGGLVAASPAWAERYEGFAYARTDGRLLYSETHWLYREDGFDEHLVLYRCADGSPFARKLLKGDSAAPDFDFYDAGLDYREGVRSTGTHRYVYTQRRNEAVPEQRELHIGTDLVVDAGFDTYLRRHWNSIAPDSPLRAAIVVPSRLDAMPVQIAEGNEGDAQTRRLRVQLDAWYRVITPSIELGYSRADHRLREFQGVGSIRDSDGRNLDVRIVFPPKLYDPDAHTPEALAAAHLGLSQQCHP